MKKFYFALLLSCLSLMGSAQLSNSVDVVVLNELYTEPGKNNKEFFELYNSSLKDINVDGYFLLSYYQNSNNDKGFFFIDFPTKTVTRGGFFVGASQSPFSVQGTINATADLNWSSILTAQTSGSAYSGTASIYKYAFNSVTGLFNSPIELTPGDVDNIFQKKSGNGADFHVFIFDKDQTITVGGNTVLKPINGFFGGQGSSIPSYIQALPNLPVNLKVGTQTIPLTVNFSALSNNQGEYVQASTGSDNGYIRTRDGQCGQWIKSAPQVNHTPGSPNGAASNVGTLVTDEQLTKISESTISVLYNVISGPTDAFPVTVRIVNDYGAVTPANPEVGVNYSKLPSLSLSEVDEEEIDNQLSGNFQYPRPIVNSGSGSNGSSFFSTYYTQPLVTALAYTNQYTGTKKKARGFAYVYQLASGCYDKVVLREFGEITLPVSFKSFTAKRNKQNVVLSWQTATEQNNAGFAIERNINGNWTEIAFVPSQANGGNSSSELSYVYNDLNNHKGISQYRIRQNDLDAKTSYSVIRSVQGEGAGPKLVIYPNPSVDGRVQLVFEDANSSRHIVISDMSGRIVRQFSNVLNSSMSVDGLNPGLYTTRVINQATGESTLQKFVIQQK